MTEFYLESVDRPNQSGVADEVIEVGELVYDEGAGVSRATFADGDHSGVATDNPEFTTAFDEDDTSNVGQYETGDRVTYGGKEDDAQIKVKTAKDTGGNEPNPAVDHGDVVGIIDTSAGTLSSTSEYQGRIVEEGYTDGEATPTTYNRSNNNFIAIGRAYRPGKLNDDTVDTFDTPVRLRVFGEVKED